MLLIKCIGCHLTHVINIQVIDQNFIITFQFKINYDFYACFFLINPKPCRNLFNNFPNVVNSLRITKLMALMSK